LLKYGILLCCIIISLKSEYCQVLLNEWKRSQLLTLALQLQPLSSLAFRVTCSTFLSGHLAIITWFHNIYSQLTKYLHSHGPTVKYNMQGCFLFVVMSLTGWAVSSPITYLSWFLFSLHSFIILLAEGSWRGFFFSFHMRNASILGVFCLSCPSWPT
jgi:hypothetical protein